MKSVPTLYRDRDQTSSIPFSGWQNGVLVCSTLSDGVVYGLFNSETARQDGFSAKVDGRESSVGTGFLPISIVVIWTFYFILFLGKDGFNEKGRHEHCTYPILLLCFGFPVSVVMVTSITHAIDIWLIVVVASAACCCIA